MHADVAQTYMNLACVLMQQGTAEKMLEAFVYLQNALKIRETVYPKGHREIAESYAALAQICYKVGDYDNALINSRTALKMYTKLYGKDSQIVHDVEYNIGLIKKEMGK